MERWVPGTVFSGTPGRWADATETVFGSHFNVIYAYDTLPKEQCWVYGNTGILAFLMEIGDHCWYTGADVDTIGARVARGGAALLDRALHGPGVMGTVTDELTGLANRWDEDDLIAYLRDPKAVQAATPRLAYMAEKYPIEMPAYAHTDEVVLRGLVGWLLTQ